MHPLHKFQELRKAYLAESFRRSEEVDALIRENAERVLRKKTLDADFYELAKEVSQIDGLDDLAYSLFSFEMAQKKESGSLLFAFWQALVKSLPKLLDLSENRLKPIEQTAASLQEQWEKRLFASKEWVHGEIFHLKPGSCCTILLPHKNPQNEFVLTSLATYSRDERGYYTIILYFAREGDAIHQGGEVELGREKILPVRLFSNLPSKELFGPSRDSSKHAESLCNAMQTNLAEAIASSYAPFSAYKIAPAYQRLVRVREGGPYKALLAFFGDCIGAQNSEEGLQLYKAVQCLSRVILTIALSHTLSKEMEEERLLSQMGAFRKAVSSSARYVLKQKDNPFLAAFFEEISETIKQLHEHADKLIRTPPLSSDPDLQNPNLPKNQKKLAAQQKIVADEFIGFLGKKLNLFKPSQESSIEHYFPKDPAEGEALDWLLKLQAGLRLFKLHHPASTLPLLNSVIKMLPLPSQDAWWVKMNFSERKKALEIVGQLSEEIVFTAFQTKARSSLETQNSAIRLLCIAHELVESLDKKKIWKDFFPSTQNYQRLTISPYFQFESLAALMHREELLNYIEEKKKSRKEIFCFEQSDPFENSQDFFAAKTLLKAYPEALREIGKELSKLKREEIKLSLEKTCFLAMMPFNNDLGISPNLTISFFRRLKALSKIAIEATLLSSPKAVPHTGYENLILTRDSFAFNLSYAVSNRASKDIFIEGADPLVVPFDMKLKKNLLPARALIESQNETLFRLLKTEGLSKAALIFEEAAAQPDLMVPHLLVALKYEHALLQEPKIQRMVELYLFKPIVKDSGEYFPLLKELKENEKLFVLLYKEFLESHFFKKEHAKEEVKTFFISLTLRLYEIACEMPCTSLKEFCAGFFKKQRSNVKAIDQLLYLYYIEMRFSEGTTWQSYLEFATQVSEMQPNSFSWIRLRFQMAMLLKKWYEEDFLKADRSFALSWDFSNFPICYSKSLEKNFDLLELSYERGKREEIPKKIADDPEFFRLFQNRVHFWRSNREEGRIHYLFQDPLTKAEFRYDPIGAFPAGITRKVDGKVFAYVPLAESAKFLLPSSVIQEGNFFIDQNGETMVYKAFNKAEPWLKSHKNGFFYFLEGEEKGMRLEFTKSKSQLEKLTGPFGCHHYAFKGRFVDREIKANFRDMLIFPNLKKTLIFIRKGLEYVEKDTPNRVLEKNLFSGGPYFSLTTSKTKGTPLLIAGIIVKKPKPTIGMSLFPYDFELILPFQKHFSDAHSQLVRPCFSPKGASSCFNSIETITINIGELSKELNPEAPFEILFCCYITLLAKDYEGALRFIKKIRPQHALEVKERLVAKWLIDSKKDASDESSSAAAIRLRAYLLFIERGLPLVGTLRDEELPASSLEETYLNYLRHLSDVPQLLRLGKSKELTLIEHGFSLFPISPKNLALLNERAKELRKESYSSEIFNVFGNEALPLLKRWETPTAKEIPREFSASTQLLQGVMEEKAAAIIPGLAYPEEAFRFHYQTLCKGLEKEKWELIYQIETCAIQKDLRAVLMMGFSKGDAAEALPELSGLAFYDAKELLEDWFNKQLEAVKLDLQKDASAFKIQSPLPKILTFNEDNQQKLLEISRKYSSHSCLKLIKKLQRAFFTKADVTERRYATLKSPFEQVHSDDPVQSLEIKFYQEEWQCGLLILSTSKNYALPSLDTFLLFCEQLKQFSLDQLSSLKNEIKRQLNRIPFGSMHAVASLEAAAMNKVEMEIEDALDMAHLASDEKRLNFLRKRNPFFSESDLKILKIFLINYLEFSVLIQTLLTIKLKCTPVLQKIDEQKNLNGKNWDRDLSFLSYWKKDPEIFELWQEIAELLSSFEASLEESDADKKISTLIFEHFCGFRMRKEQVEILSDALHKIFQKQGAVVFQLIMGGGKTSVILVRLAKIISENGRVPIFAAHHSQYPSLKANLSSGQYKRTGQDLVYFDFTRSDLSSVKVLNYIKEQLILAQKKKRLILTKGAFLQMLQLEFSDAPNAIKDPQNLDPEAEVRYRLHAEILQFIRHKCLIIADEIDSSLSILQETIYPNGSCETIKKSSLDLIKQIYQILSSHEELASLLKLSKDEQGFVTKDKLGEKIFPELVQALIKESEPLSAMIPLEQHEKIAEKIKRYILGDGDIKEFLHEECPKDALDALGLAKELCQEILPVTLSKSFNKNYGFEDNGRVIPYLGVDEPSNTEFGNIYEKACLFLQAALAKGVTKELLYSYRDKMSEAASYFSLIHRVLPESTAEARHFEALTGLSLFKPWSLEDVRLALFEINADPLRLLDLYCEFSSDLQYHTSLIKCGPIALSLMGSQFVGCSAVLWNRETFAREIAESCVLQKGTEGKILAKLLFDLKNHHSYLVAVATPTPEDILQAVLEKRGLQAQARLRALIDVCGMLKRFSNHDVAKKILEFEPLSREIDAVLVLLKFGASEAFALWKRGDSPIRLDATTKAEIEKHGVVIDRVFVYFDELRTVGSDLPLKADAVAVLTFDPNTTPLKSLLQGALRPRGFFRLQQVDIAVERNAFEGFHYYDEKDPLASLSGENCFLSALRNQASLKKIQLFRSAIEQLNEIYRSAILQKMAALADSKDEAKLISSLKLHSAASFLLYSIFQENPADFLNEQEDLPAFQIVKEHFVKLREQFLEKCLSFFELAEIEQLEGRAKNVTAWSKKTLTWKVSAYREQHLSSQVNVEKQHHKQVNIEVRKEIQKEIEKYACRIDAKAAKTHLWQRRVQEPASIRDYSLPPLLSFSDLLKRCPYEAPYHRIFPKDLILTENFSKTFAVDLPVFHPGQKKAQHLLLYSEEDEYKILFIDAHEAEFWRKEIALHSAVGCWLVDLEGHCLNEKDIPSKAQPVLDKTLFWAHFFNGDASYLRGKISFVESELKSQDFELKYRFLRVRAFNDPVQSTVLDLEPIFSSQKSKPPVFVFPSKEAEEAWQDKELTHLSKEELNRLPFHFARFLPPEKIPLLKKRGYFSYLKPQQFAFVLKEQIPLIPDNRLRYLTTLEQITAVPPERIGWLKGEGLKFLPEELLDKIDPLEIVHLPQVLQVKYQKKMVDKFGLKEFANRVVPSMASAILPECVPWLSDNCLASLKTSEQLKMVPINKFHHLSAAQFHLLPKEHWKLLKKEDYQKYKQLETVPEEASKVVEMMDKSWVDEVDPRLAAFFTDEQVANIQKPFSVKYLNQEQLMHLDGSLAEFLEVNQIPLLGKEHSHLINELKELSKLELLKDEALQVLRKSQVRLFKKREKWIKLPKHHAIRFSKEQIDAIDLKEDRAIVEALSVKQVLKLEKEKISLLLPFLNPEVLKSVDPSVFDSVDILPEEVQARLSAGQIQIFLNAQKRRKNDLSLYLKRLTWEQWHQLDSSFIHHFFDGLEKSILKILPKEKAKNLSKPSLFLYFDRDANAFWEQTAGFLSTLVYPLTLGFALTLGLIRGCASQGNFSKIFIKTFRRGAFAPLRLFFPEYYYRNIS